MKQLTQTITYDLGRQISKGGTGTIYEAKKLDYTGRPDGIRYAIKELEETFVHIADNEKNTSQKIENESRYSVIIPVLDAVRSEHKTYLVMQLKHHGMFLNEMIQNIRKDTSEGEPISFCHVRGIMQAVLSSLERLHNCMPEESGCRGYLHLDLHPGNIFMENADWKHHIYGTAKFIDLQNAMETSKSGYVRQQSKTQAIGFTNGFCAPELAEKRIKDLCIQTDLYAAAAIYMHLITGKYMDSFSCFHGGLSDYMEEAAGVHEKMLLVPAACLQLRRFLEKGLSAHINLRFLSAGEMLESLEQAWQFQELYNSGDYYTLYQLVYRSKLKIPHSSESSSHISKKGYADAVNNLSRTLKQDHIPVQECRYIFERLQPLYPDHPELADKETLIKLYWSGQAIYNHLADEKKCAEMFDRLMELKKDIHVMQWASIINRAAVAYADTFQMEKALQILRDNIQNLEKIKSAYLSIAAVENRSSAIVKLTDLGRAYSAYGTYATYERIENPMEYFEKALCEFYEGDGNSCITISHILHYAIDLKDAQLFDKWYRKLKGGAALDEWDEIRIFIDTENARKNWFDLWLYLKAVYTFGLQNKISGLPEKITELLDNQAFRTCGQHPSALILKYCGLILYSLHTDSYRCYAEKAFKRSMQLLESKSKKGYGELTLFKIMAYHVDSEAKTAIGDTESAGILYKEFMEKLEGTSFYNLKDWLTEYNKDRKFPKIALKGEYC